MSPGATASRRRLGRLKTVEGDIQMNVQARLAASGEEPVEFVGPEAPQTHAEKPM